MQIRDSKVIGLCNFKVGNHYEEAVLPGIFKSCCWWFPYCPETNANSQPLYKQKDHRINLKSAKAKKKASSRQNQNTYLDLISSYLSEKLVYLNTHLLLH